MPTRIDVAACLALFGQIHRLRMIYALATGGEKTLNELAVVAGIEAQSAQPHLKKMLDAGLVTRRRVMLQSCYSLVCERTKEGLEFTHPSGARVVLPLE